MKSKISRSKTLRSQLYEYLLEQIVSGQLMPGERLIEEKIAEETGVSRSPIREAIRRLEKEGLVTVNPNGGVRVFNPTPADYQLLYECRLSLEPSAAYYSAQRIGQAHAAKIEHLIGQMTIEGPSYNAGQSREWNREFHRLIVGASGNPYLIQMMDQLQALLLLYRNVILQVPMRYAQGIDEHRAIYDSIRAGDGNAARKLMEEHIHNDFKICMNYFHMAQQEDTHDTEQTIAGD